MIRWCLLHSGKPVYRMMYGISIDHFVCWHLTTSSSPFRRIICRIAWQWAEVALTSSIVAALIHNRMFGYWIERQVISIAKWFNWTITQCVKFVQWRGLFDPFCSTAHRTVNREHRNRDEWHVWQWQCSEYWITLAKHHFFSGVLFRLSLLKCVAFVINWNAQRTRRSYFIHYFSMNRRLSPNFLLPFFFSIDMSRAWVKMKSTHR